MCNFAKLSFSSNSERNKKKNIFLRAGFEPATYGCPYVKFQLQSTALPTELSKAVECCLNLTRLEKKFED